MLCGITMKKLSTNSTVRVPIGGLQKLSLVDFPGRTAACIFTLGCNMRCGYCHNPELVLPEQFLDAIPVDTVLDWLDTRRGKLDGVVISGGEPTIHDDIPLLARELKSRGFAVKLDSNGTRPSMIAEMIEDGLIDFVAMDVKGPLETYSEIAARPIDTDAIQQTIQLLIQSGIDHEFRTTIVKSQIPISDFEKIGQLVHGAKRFALQHFKPGITVSPQFENETTYGDEEFETIKKIMERHVQTCVIH